MALTAEEVWEHVRALPPRERFKLVERVVHEAAEAEAQSGADDERPLRVTEGTPIYQDLSDEEFDEFMEIMRRNRNEQPLRTPR